MSAPNLSPSAADRPQDHGVFESSFLNRARVFLKSIGIDMEPATLERKTFLPGVRIEGTMLHVDESRLEYPGDILHEAGHIAVAPPSRRGRLKDQVSNDPAEEMMAIAWSWAALKHLQADPRIVFHDAFKGGSDNLIDAFSNGGGCGVPVLQWLGMTAEGPRAEELGVSPFPHMIEWVRTRETGG
ncbi:hypothetical protein Thimo_0335 [Thioflavicoccus mobilis 8321]|uniref:Uncharacterized protein n=1 Tax=Thioflavicoccus mobilis 8321 TaxID=765912 RepID=L0GV11_9GAMM|nr:hypothetical protein [Thioflavicoccus mobilis]AGA89205.1 hypothetical protein Thimo_0335 [Thioflavicoccus mobilis 8321]